MCSLQTPAINNKTRQVVLIIWALLSTKRRVDTTIVMPPHIQDQTQVWRAAVFESVAMFAMVFVGTLCTIASLETGFQHPVLAIAIFQALALALCILAAAPASGGHVNPCITWTEMLTGHITPVRALLYIAGQALGSIVASLDVKKVVGHTLAWKYMLGGCYLHSQVSATSGVVGLETGRAFLLEIVLSFFVLFVAYSVALDPPRLPKTGPTLAPFIIGGLVGLCIFAGGNLVPGYAGAGVNPGRCLGPAVALGESLWTGHWVFWAGPGVAGLAMAAMYRTIPPTHIEAYERRRHTDPSTISNNSSAAAKLTDCTDSAIGYNDGIGGVVTSTRIRKNISQHCVLVPLHAPTSSPVLHRNCQAQATSCIGDDEHGV